MAKAKTRPSLNGHRRKPQATAKRNNTARDLELIEQLVKASKSKRQHSIMELEGLGAEMWRELWRETGMDAVEYIRRERDAWD